MSIFCLSYIYSEDLAKLAARKYARIVQKLDFPVSMHYVHYFILMSIKI